VSEFRPRPASFLRFGTEVSGPINRRLIQPAVQTQFPLRRLHVVLGQALSDYRRRSVELAHGLVLLFGIGTKQTCELTSSVVPRRTSSLRLINETLQRFLSSLC
jgi:hypothetical protein